MKEIEPNRSAASWLAELAKGRYGEYALSVLTALLGITCSLIPYSRLTLNIVSLRFILCISLHLGTTGP